MVKLTDRTVKTAPAGRHMDGTVRGLSLLVKPTGGRSWVLRYQHKGARHDMGLGPYPEVSLAEARETALEHRRALKVEKVDPLAARRAAEAEAARAAAQVLTFKAAAEALIESKRPGWRNAKHACAVGDHAADASLSQARRPRRAGDRHRRRARGAASRSGPTKPETASRVRQRIEAVLDYAKAIGQAHRRQPGALEGATSTTCCRSRARSSRSSTMPALDWREAPAFMAELAKREGIGAKALAFAILTAARSGEVRGMTWGEVDDDASVWTVPGARMKAGKEHRVPLTPAALALLGERGAPDALVFPSPKDAAKPLSDMTLMAVLRRMGRGDLTVHGFRSTFRDWAGETTAHPREVIEAALAHRLKDKAEAAYARGDLFAKRRRLMEDWAAFLARPAG